MIFTPVTEEWIPAIYPQIEKPLSFLQQKKEIKRCKDGIKGCIYFIERYYKINLPKASKTEDDTDSDSQIRERLALYNPYVEGFGIMPCCLLPVQKNYVIPNVLSNRYSVLDKPRQMGMSVITGAICLWEMLFTPGSAIEVISKNHKAAKDYIKKVRQGFEYLPNWMKSWFKIPRGMDNVMNFGLDNKSKISASAATDDAGRSDTLTRIILDEAAWGGLKDKAEDIFAAAEPTLANTGGSATVISTHNGIGTWYHRLTVEAAANISDWFHVDIPWHSFPGRNYIWLASKLKKFGRRKVAQEYLKDALGSGNTVIPTESIEHYERQTRTPLRTESGDRLRIFEEPDPDAAYIMGADVGQGAGQDASAFVILRADTRKVVCCFKGSVGTRAFSLLMKKYAIMYNSCLIAVEVTGCGDACREDLTSNDAEYNYSNLFYMIGVGGRAASPGWKTTSASRPLLIACLETHIGEAMDVIIPDDRIVKEMTTFIWTDKGRPDHERGYHDDALFALMIAIKALEISPVINTAALKDPIKREEMKAAIMAKIEAQKKVLMEGKYMDTTEAAALNLDMNREGGNSFSALDMLKAGR